MFEVFVLDGCLCVCVCHCCSVVWNNRDLPAQQEAVGFCLSLHDPNRSPDITVSLPGRKPNAGPISNLVFHKIWQLASDDKLTTILLPPGNLWQYCSTHTQKQVFLPKNKVVHVEHAGSLKLNWKQKMAGCIAVCLQIQAYRGKTFISGTIFCDIQHLAERRYDRWWAKQSIKGEEVMLRC